MGQTPWEGASRSYLVPKVYYRFTVALNYQESGPNPQISF